MVVGRLGMPDVGGSYFTFSNENNDLIWGFLAECHRRGWIYRGHDTMPWCPRCGTGLSQMEMNEGYQDREDPGLTVRFPLVDRPGRVAARVDDDAVDAGRERGRGRRRRPRATSGSARARTCSGSAGGRSSRSLQGPFKVVEEARRRGPRRLALHGAVRRPAGGPRRVRRERGYEHRVVAWSEVGEEEGTGIVHIAPGCGAEDFQLGKRSACRSSARSTRTAATTRASAGSAGREAPAVTEAIVDDLERRGVLLPPRAVQPPLPALLAVRHAAAVPPRRRVVHQHGPGLRPAARDADAAQVDASLRYQIMEVVDRIRWIPSFGYERELDWLLNMRDWMISKKRYYGLALPIYDCAACGTFDVIGGREELQRARGRGLGGVRGPHAAPAVRGRGQDRLPVVRRAGRADPRRRQPLARCRASCPFSTLHYREEPEYWAKWFPADFVTESFPGQFRNWFYAMLAMSTVLRREEPFRTIFGYATLFGEDGRPMHKSWGNAIEFDEAAERMGVDVMRWMYASARPEDNILFGWHAADEARRELLVLWNVYAFFVTYARLAGWTPRRRAIAAGRRAPGARPLDPVARGGGRRGASRRGCATSTPRRRRGWSTRTSTTCPPGTCGCHGGGCRAAPAPTAMRRSRRSTQRSSRSRAPSRRSSRS